MKSVSDCIVDHQTIRCLFFTIIIIIMNKLYIYIYIWFSSGLVLNDLFTLMSLSCRNEFLFSHRRVLFSPHLIIIYHSCRILYSFRN